MNQSLTTQLVGSFTKPSWLIRHHRVTSPASDFWRPEPEVLSEAQDDATIAAIRYQEQAGLDVITDGEQRRQRYDTYFFRFGGIDNEILGRWSMDNRDMSFIELDPAVKQRLDLAMTARVVGEITWPGPMALEDLRFLKKHTGRRTKITVIGPLTTAVRLVNEYYPDEESLAMAIARAINQELKALDTEGVDIIQLDEPDFHFRPDAAVKWGSKCLDIAFDGIKTTKAVHMCYGYAMIGDKHVNPNYSKVLQAIAQANTDQISIEYEQPGHRPDLLEYAGDKIVVLGLLDLGKEAIETPEYLVSRIREALEIIPPERLHVAPDCGMWFLPRKSAFGKLQSLVKAAEIVRHSL